MTPLSRLSIRTQLTLRWTTAFAVLLAAVNVAIYWGIWAVALRDFDDQLRTIAATELSSSTDVWLDVHLHDWPETALAGFGYAAKFAQILDPDGQVRLADPNLRGSLMPANLLPHALSGAVPTWDGIVDGARVRGVALASEHRGQRFVLVVGVSQEPLYGMMRRIAGLLLSVWALGLLLTAGLGFALASKALAPIDHITRRARAVAHGDFATRLDPPRSDDEIGRMTTLLNQMLERLHGAVVANRRFAADASHELRSPLTAIAGEVDVALKRERTSAEYRDTLSVVRARVRHMKDLIEDLMLLGHAQEASAPPVVEELALRPLLEAAVGRVQCFAADRGRRVELGDVDADVVYGDGRLFARVFDNLLHNGVAYNRDGGKVVVSASSVDAASGAWATDRVRVTVRDQGLGIPPAEWESIFERFHRLDQSRTRATGGSGLGLAICRSVVTLYGGTVRVAESSSRGTTFEVELPGRRHAATPPDAR